MVVINWEFDIPEGSFNLLALVDDFILFNGWNLVEIKDILISSIEGVRILKVQLILLLLMIFKPFMKRLTFEVILVALIKNLRVKDNPYYGSEFIKRKDPPVLLRSNNT